MFLGVSWLAVHMHARADDDRHAVRALRDRARRLPGGPWSGFMYWVVQIFTLAVLVLAANTSFQGFPRLAALLARDRFFAAPVHEPRRPARLLERDRRPRRRSRGAALGLRRERRLADPPLRDRRLHGVHALAGGHGALLAAHARPGLALPRRRQRRRRDRDRPRRRDRHLDEVHRGRLARDRRDPAARPAFLGINRHYRRFARRLRAGVDAVRAARARRRTRCCSGSSRSTSRPKARSGTRGTIATAADPGDPRAGHAHRPRHPSALVRLRAGGAAARGARRRRGPHRRRCSRRSGACRAARPTS